MVEKTGNEEEHDTGGLFTFFLLGQAEIAARSASPSWASAINSFCTPEATNHGRTGSAEELN
jgi:hypothetical protein